MLVAFHCAFRAKMQRDKNENLNCGKGKSQDIQDDVLKIRFYKCSILTLYFIFIPSFETQHNQ